MNSIVILYSSGQGHTRTVAEHILIGVAAFAGTNAEQIEVTPAQLGRDGRWHDAAIVAKLDAADAIVFGAPTYKGSAHGLFE